MKKVVYSIRKVRNSDEKLSGLGFINSHCLTNSTKTMLKHPQTTV